MSEDTKPETIKQASKMTPTKVKAKPEAKDSTVEMSPKTLDNTDDNVTAKNVNDVVAFGSGDLFQLISKASSQQEGWMKSTKAMAVHGVGVTLQVTTQQGDQVAEALTFIPGAKIVGEPGSLKIVKA